VNSKSRRKRKKTRKRNYEHDQFRREGGSAGYCSRKAAIPITPLVRKIDQP